VLSLCWKLPDACQQALFFWAWLTNSSSSTVMPHMLRRYGGTVARENVAAEADWFVYDIHAVLDALQ
jgi:hypothetical protein